MGTTQLSGKCLSTISLILVLSWSKIFGVKDSRTKMIEAY